MSLLSLYCDFNISPNKIDCVKFSLDQTNLFCTKFDGYDQLHVIVTSNNMTRCTATSTVAANTSMVEGKENERNARGQ
jgi:hypothetical protein